MEISLNNHRSEVICFALSDGCIKVCVCVVKAIKIIKRDDCDVYLSLLIDLTFNGTSSRMFSFPCDLRKLLRDRER